MAAASEDYGDDYDEYYDDEEEQGASGLLILAVILLIIVIFSLIVVFAYKRGMADERARAGEIPLVTAEAGPVKTERELDLPTGTNSEVDATLSGNPPAEMLLDAGEDGDPLGGDYQETMSAAEQAETDPEPVTTTAPREQETTPARNEQPAVSQPAEDNPAAALPTRQEPQPQPATRPAATAAGAASGTHLVQVGAFGSDAEANTFYERMQDRYTSLMSGKAPDIQRADLGDRGIYHRLRIGPFASQSAASDWCGQLKAAGQDCLVRAVD